jgi:L-aspartate oxidase
MRENFTGRSPHHATPAKPEAISSNGHAAETEKLVQKVQGMMWQHVGVVRDGKPLQQVVPELRALQSQLPPSGDRRSREAANILETGLLIARSALAREESRGAHYRLDHPLRNDVKYQKHSVVNGDNIRFQ